MFIEIQITNIINDKLKNPIYTRMQLLNLKTILVKSNFTKKEGVAVHMVVLHFVYMLVMNKKIATFMKQSNESLKKMSTIDYFLIVHKREKPINLVI